MQDDGSRANNRTRLIASLSRYPLECTFIKLSQKINSDVLSFFSLLPEIYDICVVDVEWTILIIVVSQERIQFHSTLLIQRLLQSRLSLAAHNQQ